MDPKIPIQFQEEGERDELESSYGQHCSRMCLISFKVNKQFDDKGFPCMENLTVQGSAKRRAPGCLNATGKQGQGEAVSYSRIKIHQTWSSPFSRAVWFWFFCHSLSTNWPPAAAKSPLSLAPSLEPGFQAGPITSGALQQEEELAILLFNALPH